MRLMSRFRHGYGLSVRAGRVALAGLLAVAAALGPASPSVAASGQHPETSLRIMPLGDSITFGKGDATENGSRAPLHAWLTETAPPVVFVGSQLNGPGPGPRHEGHPGWR